MPVLKVKQNGIWEDVTSASKPTHNAISIFLPASNWSNMKQTVTVGGVTIDNTIVVTPSPSSHENYCGSGVYCFTQSNNQLTFICTDVPTSDLTVNVMILN